MSYHNDKLQSSVETFTSKKTDTVCDNDVNASSLQRRDGLENETVKPNDEEEYEKGTDEDDGLLGKAGKVMRGVAKKILTKKDDIEPYAKDPPSWTYSKYGTESNEDDEATIATNQLTGHIKQSLSQQNDSKTSNIPDSDIYDFKHPRRGYLLLVINEKFYRQARRQGARLDLLKMKTVAKKLGLQFLNDTLEMNLSKPETMSWLQKAQTTDHTDCDCFMFMISTHGLEQENPRKGGQLDHALVCADDELIFTSTIIEMFNDSTCPTLKGKPKIFIIQACRGSDLDHGSDVSVIASTNLSYKSRRDKTAKSDHATIKDFDRTDSKAGMDSCEQDSTSDTEAPCLQCDTDMLVMYAVPPGMLAWRNTSDGSWMIHYLHEVLLAYDRKFPQNFLHVLTKVSARMSRRTTAAPEFPELHEKKAVPVIENKLTKDILFS